MGDQIHFPRKPVREPTLPKRALANHLQVSVKTIERWMKEDDFPEPERTREGHARFRLSLVNEWRERKAS